MQLFEYVKSKKVEPINLQVRLRPHIPQYLKYNPKLLAAFQRALVATQAPVQHLQ